LRNIGADVRKLLATKGITAMQWTVVSFGRYAGKTLPEILITDPDWFCYMLSKLYGRLREEADELHLRVRGIRIPKLKPSKFEIEYRYDPEGRFEGFSIVRAGSPQHSKFAERLPYLDLLKVIGRKQYDKRSGKKVIRDFRTNYFGDDKRLTKHTCERFFDNDRNFLFV
jgi:hypothetical protein